MNDPRQADSLFDTDVVDPPPTRPALVSWALADLPYVTMLALAVGGVAWTTFTNQPTVGYWIFLAPVFGLISIGAGWPHARSEDAHWRLVIEQALLWVAILLAMFLYTTSAVRGIANSNATGLALLTLLALGTFVSGLQARVWRISIVGVFLGISVPVVAWLQQSALLLTLGALALVALTTAVWWRRRR